MTRGRDGRAGRELSRCFSVRVRLSCSVKGVDRVYASQAQEAFLEGHVTASEVTGGVPFLQIRYDNLSPAVAKVLTGGNRTETKRWLSFRRSTGRGVVLPARAGRRP